MSSSPKMSPEEVIIAPESDVPATFLGYPVVVSETLGEDIAVEFGTYADATVKFGKDGE